MSLCPKTVGALTLGAIIAFCTLPGCKIYQAEIPDLNNQTDVPPNVILRVVYKGENWISKKAEKTKGLFTLTNCVGDAPKESAEKKDAKAESDASAEKTDPKKETDTPQAAKISIPFFTHVIRKPAVTSKERGTVQETDFFIIPYSTNSDDPPLLPGERYCFEVADITSEGKTGETVLGNKVSFQVDKKSDFLFNAGEGLGLQSWTNKKIKANEAILVKLNDAVNPSDLSKGTYLCNRSAAGRGSSSTCETDGESESRQVYQLENLKKHKDEKYLTAKFDLFAFTGSPAFKPAEKYVLKVGAAVAGGEKTDRQSAGNVSFAPMGERATRTADPKTAKKESGFVDEADDEDVAAGEPTDEAGEAPTVTTAPSSAKDQEEARKASLKKMSEPLDDTDSIVWIPINSST